VLNALRTRQAGREGATFSKDVLAAMTASQAATNEFLRQFWAAVLPPKADDISANALAGPKERYDKATRLRSYLEKTRARADAVVAAVPAEDADRVREVRAPRPGCPVCLA
jgi:transcription initiation factor TFIIH subunit 1